MNISKLPSVLPVSNVDMEDRLAPMESDRLQADRVSLSTSVQELHQKKLDHLNELADQIEKGTYKIDLDQLAEAIVNKSSLIDDLGLLGKK